MCPPSKGPVAEIFQPLEFKVMRHDKTRPALHKALGTPDLLRMNPPGTPESRIAVRANALAANGLPSIIDTGEAEKRARAAVRSRRGMANTFLTSPAGVLGQPLTQTATAGGR